MKEFIKKNGSVVVALLLTLLGGGVLAVSINWSDGKPSLNVSECTCPSASVVATTSAMVPSTGGSAAQTVTAGAAGTHSK